MVKNGDYKLKIEHRITSLEEGSIRIEGVLEDLKSNHLAHLQETVDCLDKKVQKINVRMAYYVGGATALLGTIDILSRLL